MSSSSSSKSIQTQVFLSMTLQQKLFVYLSAVFVSCLLLCDVIGGKTIRTPLGPISVGIIPFPITFLLTDMVNDFYGRKGAQFLTILGFWMAVLAWCVLQCSTWLITDESTYFTQPEFQKIFGGSAQLFLASMISYLIGQFFDIHIFQFWKSLTQSRHLWLRASGSTMLSQIFDTVTVNVIFWTWSVSSDPLSFLAQLPSSARWHWIFAKIGREYLIKLVVVMLLTPVVYMLHALVMRVLDMQPVEAEKWIVLKGRSISLSNLRDSE
ncbi:queuosine precursor transporter [Pajaroellobacter abortibovis]|uniref:Probable queuosine precursor transporter n=1 Tax=Pajaroellobacter abortibovis TaxID=1882918 RepID=A0A1L6MYI0_9BACT|nr:queuosine precursor transporter [Pajaroellobacter abortibovis]APS00633.1 hypothetical protein BCY86_08075 [Pajaroellobacter abortibovis]